MFVPLLFSLLAPADVPAEFTFAEHVAPLVHAECAGCHRPGGAGPFSLLSYRDVSKRADFLRAVIESGYMPPWPPSAGGPRFAHERDLTDEQVATFAAWVEAGTPEGDAAKTPPPPQFPPDGWTLGTPDLVVSMDRAFDVPADGRDIYRTFVVPLGLAEDRWVRAVEYRPSARTAVHHSLFFLDDTGASRKRDAADPTPGFRGMAPPTGYLGAHVPGDVPQFLSDGLALPLPAGSDLVLQTHFHPTGKPESERSTVGIYFADGPPRRQPFGVQVPPVFGRKAGIDIPPGESDYTIRETLTLPVDCVAHNVAGHAHYVCRAMTLTATPPDGETLRLDGKEFADEATLLKIDDWDLDWQGRYEFAEPVALPAGTVLTGTLVYDNSAANTDNPFSPPRRITWGEQSTDEMGSLTLMLTAVRAEDERALHAVAARTGLAGRLQPRSNPDDAAAAKVLERLDRDGDGVLTRGELPEKYRARFARYDADGDGRVTAAELRAGGL